MNIFEGERTVHQQVDRLAERFDSVFMILMQNLGPQLISRAQLELTPGQVFMLHFIRQNQELSVSVLAEKMEVAPSAITVMLDRLESRAYVGRVRDKNDRRVVLIHVTEEGNKALDHVLAIRRRALHYCLAQLPADRLGPFMESLEMLANAAQKMDIHHIIGEYGREEQN